MESAVIANNLDAVKCLWRSQCDVTTSVHCAQSKRVC